MSLTSLSIFKKVDPCSCSARVISYAFIPQTLFNDVVPETSPMPARLVTAAAHDRSKLVYMPQIVTTSCCKWHISTYETDHSSPLDTVMQNGQRWKGPSSSDTCCCCCCCAEEVYMSWTEARFLEHGQPRPTNICGMSLLCSLLPFSPVSIFISSPKLSV